MSRKSIFRKVSLERLSSPEQLDQLMTVTNPTGWLALGGLGAMVLAAFAWSIYGSIPTEAMGEGILIRRGGVRDLVATGEGQVEEVLVELGEEIAEGQAVARIRQDSLLRNIQDAEARKAAEELELQELRRFSTEQKRLSARNLQQERSNLLHTVETLERDLRLLGERKVAEEELLSEGLITKQNLLATEQEMSSTEDRLASSRLQLDGLDLRRLEGEQQLDQQIEGRRAAVRELELELAELRAQLEENIHVVSPYSGRVLELMADQGDLVRPGTSILSLEVVSEELVAVLYVPAASGKRVEPGMEARVTPSTVKREEFGFMLGKVVRASEFPSTSRGMERLLSNDALVERLMSEGPPIQIDIALDPDAATPTGFRWSSSTGPDVEITSGTMTGGSIIVDESRPIRLVIPKIREKLGL